MKVKRSFSPILPTSHRWSDHCPSSQRGVGAHTYLHQLIDLLFCAFGLQKEPVGIRALEDAARLKQLEDSIFNKCSVWRASFPWTTRDTQVRNIAVRFALKEYSPHPWPVGDGNPSEQKAYIGAYITGKWRTQKSIVTQNCYTLSL